MLKWGAVFCTAFQGFALYLGQPFSPMAYCGAIALLFGGNSAHENFKAYIDSRSSE